MVVNLDEAALVHDNAGFGQTEAFGERLATRCDQYDISLNCFCRTACHWFEGDSRALFGLGDARDF